MTSIRLWTLLLLLIAATAAGAAEPVFPAAARIGIVPPASMVASRAFPGFVDAQHNAVLSLVELPTGAYDDLAKGFGPEALKAQGVAVELREDVSLKDGPGFIIAAKLPAREGVIRRWALITRSELITAVVTFQFPMAASAAYPDEMVRAVLMSLVIRSTVPDEERLGILPFRLTHLGGFRIARVAPGGVAMLTDGPKDEIELTEQSIFIVAIGPGSPDPGERDSFARRAIASAPGLKEMRIQRTEPLRIVQGQGHEIIAEAKDEKSGADLTVVQWLRFGTSGHVRMLGVARKDTWASVFPKLRALRDGLELR